MNNVLDESKSETAAGSRSLCSVACCGDEMQEAVRRVEKSVNAAKDAVSAKLDDGRIAAGRLVKRGRFAVEDGIEETAQTVKRHPLSSIAIAFATGAALGFLAPRFSKK